MTTLHRGLLLFLLAAHYGHSHDHPGAAKPNMAHQQDGNAKERTKLPCERLGFYRHPLDCTKFYQCSEYRTAEFHQSGSYAEYHYECPSGLVYDERQGSCIWPSMSDPCQGSGELLPVPDKKFACSYPGFHVDPENCRWFYYCSDLGDGRLEAFEFLCPSDLLGFDEEKMLCNWKWTVPICVSTDKQHIHFQNASPPTISPGTVGKLREGGAEFQDPFSTTANRTVQELLKLSPYVTKSVENGTHNNRTPEDVKESTDYTKDIGQRVEKVKTSSLGLGANSEKKYGTAVWRRSWIQGGTNNHRSMDHRSIRTRLKNERNKEHSNHDSLVPNANNASRTADTRTNSELQGLLKGHVSKIELSGRTYNIQHEDENNFPRSTENADLNEKHIFSQKQNDTIHVTRFRALNKESNVSFQEPTQINSFPNVRCLKLNTEQHSGCTSEVSLTIQVKNQNILKDEPIARTGYQESQEIRFSQNPQKKEDVTINPNLEAEIREVSPSFLSSSGIKKLPESMGAFNLPSEPWNSSTKLRHDTVIAPSRNVSQFPLSESSESVQNTHSKQENNNPTHSEGNSPLEKIPLAVKDASSEWIDRKVDPIQSMHLYPQGVLLNIDLAHINKIPPQILLEVDLMLKKYMRDGNIHLKQLEKKLNASIESMSKKEDTGAEQGVMEVMKWIENAIHLSGDAMNHDSKTVDDVMNSTKTEQFEYEKVPQENPALGDSSRDPISKTEAPQTRSISEKIKNEDTSKNKQMTGINDEKPYGRNRLVRKFRYPSIREQLMRQHFRMGNTSEVGDSQTGMDAENQIKLGHARLDGTRLGVTLTRERNSTPRSVKYPAKADETILHYPFSKTSVVENLTAVAEGFEARNEASRQSHEQQSHLKASQFENRRVLQTVATGFGAKRQPSHLKAPEFERKTKFPLNNRDQSRANFNTDISSPDFYYTLPLGAIPLQTDSRQWSLNSPDDNILPTKQTSTNKKAHFNSTVKRGGKRRKLRILVRKFPKTDPIQVHERALLDIENSDVEKRISQNILRTLPNHFLTNFERDGMVQVQDHVWNIPFASDGAELTPSACIRAGLFVHPRDCGMFYECFWDKWLQRFTLHVFSCPVRLVYDHSVRGCSRTTSMSHCTSSTQ